MMRPLVVLAIIAALYPVVVLIDFFSFVIQAHMQLGRWPNFGDPDPNAITAGMQRIRIGLGLIGFPVASTGAVGLALYGRYRQKDFPIWTVVALTAGLSMLLCRLAIGTLLLVMIGSVVSLIQIRRLRRQLSETASGG